MSLTSLRLSLDYYAEIDAANDRFEKKQGERRAAKLSDQETEYRAAALYEKVAKKAARYANREKAGYSSVPLATHPECVVTRVIAMFAAKGIKAQHIFNEHTPRYDVLDIDLSTVRIG
jgi:hypothetical protein